MPLRRWRIRAVVGALCLAFFLQCFFASCVKSPANDECLHIMAGAAAGIAALFLWAADPTMTGHGYFVTTDSGVTAFGMLSLLALYRYLQQPGKARAAMAGVTLGLALCAKFSAIFLLPIAAILAFVAFRPHPRPRDKRGRAKSIERPGFPVKGRLTEFTVLVLAALVVIDICYFSLKGPFLYCHGLGRVHADHRPDFEAFLGGAEQHRFLSYFAAAWLLKEPLATVGLALGGAYLVIRDRAMPRLAKCFLFLPPIVFFLACTFWAEDIGIRYLMPAMPFGFLLGGMALVKLFQGRVAARIVGGAACVWVIVAAAGIYPDHLSYFNEMACVPNHTARIGLDGGSRCGSDWLADSNVDWGQSLPQLKQWLDRNLPGQTVAMKYFGNLPPSAYGISSGDIPNTLVGPPPGVYVVSSHHVAYWGYYNSFSWMRAEPNTVVGHAYSIFRF